MVKKKGLTKSNLKKAIKGMSKFIEKDVRITSDIYCAFCGMPIVFFMGKPKKFYGKSIIKLLKEDTIKIKCPFNHKYPNGIRVRRCNHSCCYFSDEQKVCMYSDKFKGYKWG